MMLAQEVALNTGFPLLTAIVLLPVIGAIAVAVLSKRRPELVKTFGLVFSVATGALTVYLLAKFHTHEAGYQFVTKQPWIPDWGTSWHLGVDGVSIFLVVLTGVLFPIALLGADPHHDRKPYTAWILLLEAGVLGSFLALDILLFFLFFEIVLVPMYFLIAGWGYDKRRYAATKFFLFTLAGSALMFVGVLVTTVLHHKGTGVWTTDLIEIAKAQAIPFRSARLLFLAFAIAFAVKVPLFPLHTWLPDAHTQAPTAGSVILAGVMLKLGTYGFIRFGLELFPEASHHYRKALIVLGVIGIIYGAICATMQTDLKRLVAYSSVAHLGFIILGTFALTTVSANGAVLQMINHGVSTGGLFLMVGMLYERRHTRAIAELKGIQKVAPIFAGFFTLIMLSSIGVPGLNGFVGEFLVLIGSFRTARWFTVVAAAGVILAALYLLWAYQRVFHGEPDDANKSFRELKLSEGLVLLPLIGLIVFCGVYPKPMLDRIEPSVRRIMATVEEKSNDPTYKDPDGVAAVESADSTTAVTAEGNVTP
jgi:NADH-quinone oxidoreductase subunit M